MSSASKSKAKDKNTGKESQKMFLKSSILANAGVGIPSNGYNPLLGTFHALESAPVSSTPTLRVNGHFENMDETGDHSSNSHGNGVDSDSISNNGSWSGESEDHKEKVVHPAPHLEVPGVDNNKRDKIRLKNEKKHQRQRERRAQELHEKCSGYIMSRKLEALAQQLVAMGFSSERATVALILNEGKVEKSVAWLFEGVEDADEHREPYLDCGKRLNIDISEEIARIEDMECKYKCSKQEVARAIVACEGDLEKAEENLEVQKREPASAFSKPEGTGDTPTVTGKFPSTIGQYLMKGHPNLLTSSSTQEKKNEKGFNYKKVGTSVGSAIDPGSKNVESLKTNQSKMEWAKSEQIVMPFERRFPNIASNPTVPGPLASPSQASHPQTADMRYIRGGSELKKLQLGSVREPVIVLQRPTPANGKQTASNFRSSSTGNTAGWGPTNVETMNFNAVVSQIPFTRNPSSSCDIGANQLYNQHTYQQQQQIFMNGSMDYPEASLVNGLSCRKATSFTVSATSSLGLFSGFGLHSSAGSSAPIGWNTGSSMLQLDYTNIDWSLDQSSLTSNGIWQGMNSFMQKNSRAYESGRNIVTNLRPPSNVNAVSVVGLQERVASTEMSRFDSRGWDSPFEGKDLFSIPRERVFSPM